MTEYSHYSSHLLLSAPASQKAELRETKCWTAALKSEDKNIVNLIKIEPDHNGILSQTLKYHQWSRGSTLKAGIREVQGSDTIASVGLMVWSFH